MKRLHVHVAVKDLDTSIGFYSKLFAAERPGRRCDEGARVVLLRTDLLLVRGRLAKDASVSELRAAGEEDLAVIHVGSARQHYGHSVFNGSVRASVRSETSCRCAFQRRDE